MHAMYILTTNQLRYSQVQTGCHIILKVFLKNFHFSTRRTRILMRLTIITVSFTNHDEIHVKFCIFISLVLYIQPRTQHGLLIHKWIPRHVVNDHHTPLFNPLPSPYPPLSMPTVTALPKATLDSFEYTCSSNSFGVDIHYVHPSLPLLLSPTLPRITNSDNADGMARVESPQPNKRGCFC